MVVGFSLLVEVITLKSALWQYFPVNYPAALLPAYLGTGLLGYQLVKKIEEIIS